MTALSFQRELENSSGMKLKLKINDNLSTMLSVRWEPDCTRVSLHRMFLQAPQNVMQELACYIKKEHKVIPSNVKFFIEDNVKKLDYRHLLDQKKFKISTQGSVYNLQKIYDELNQEYFNSSLDLKITWFGKPYMRPRSQVTFGLYHDPLKLIKIHRLLDSPILPDYVVSYVVYHEMLHNVCPSYRDKKGIHCIHSKEFKKRETKFRHFNLAQNWIREHYGYLFRD